MNLLGACDDQQTRMPGKFRKAKAPKPVKIEPFKKTPGVVLLFTGQNSGKLEVCNCSGPMPGGFARRSGLISSYRARYKQTFVVDTGDLFSIFEKSLANKFIAKAYKMMGYDAVAIGDQELLAGCDALLKILQESKLQAISTNLKFKNNQLNSIVKKAVTYETQNFKLAILSAALPESFLFFPEKIKKEFKIESLKLLKKLSSEYKNAGFCIGIILHGSADEVAIASNELKADFFLRGNTEISEDEPLYTKNKKPIYLIGSPDDLGALAISKNDKTQKFHFEFRNIIVDEDYPIDKRMLEIYQAYAHAEMRRRLDAPRKKGLEFVPSSTCGKCHEKQYEIWKKSRHASAWKSLVKVKRTIDPNCVSCHTLGFDMKGGFFTYRKTPELAGVHCQNCHRINVDQHTKPGFKYKPVTAEVCETCHTPVTDPKFISKEKIRFKKMGCPNGKGLCPKKKTK